MNTRVTDEGIPIGMERLMGDKTGLLEQFTYHAPGRGEPVSFQTAPELCDLGYLFGVDAQVNLNVTGKGLNFVSSSAACVGELAERYSMSWPSRDRMVRASYRDLSESDRVVDFEWLAIYDQEFRDEHLDELTRDTELLWEAGTNLLTGEAVYVPAELIWNRFQCLAEEPLHLLGTSNGVATGPTMEAAMLWGVLEAIERDGIMRTWWRQQPCPSTTLCELPGMDWFRDTHLPNEDISVHVFECESRVDIPTYLGMLASDGDRYPKAIVAGSAAPDAREAVTDAAIETCQGWTYTHYLKATTDVDTISTDDMSNTLEDNLVYYAHPENFSDLSFLFDGPTLDAASLDERNTDAWSIRRELDFVVERLAEADCTPIAFDLTASDVRDAGLNVAKVFVPELVPLKPAGFVPSDHPDFADESLTDKPHPFP